MYIRHHDMKKGFTIVELLIVIVVIGILAAIVLVAYNGISDRSKTAAISLDLNQASKQIQIYAVNNSEQLPTTFGAAGIQNDANSTYQYSVNSAVSPNTYCLTLTYSNKVGHIASNGQPVNGPCPGHTGTVPTTLDDGSSCPMGFVVVPGSSLYNTHSFCVMKYEAKNVSGVATSQAAGSPWVSVTQTQASTLAAAACSGCHLITEAEWLTIAQNAVQVASNWTSGTVGSGSLYIGHTDNSPSSTLAASTDDNNGYYGTGNSTGSNQRRTLNLSNGSVIWDLSGNVWDWTSGVLAGSGQPGASGYTFRDWNALTVKGTINPDPYPAYAYGPAAGWSSAYGIGQVVSNSDETASRSFLRGGYSGDGNIAGIFRLSLNYDATVSSTLVGFRVAR